MSKGAQNSLVHAQRTFYKIWYRVIHKRLSYKTEDKMQEKIKMILQVDENLAHL